MAFKAGKDKKIRASKSKNTEKIEFRDDDKAAADKWFGEKHYKKLADKVKKIKFKK